MITKTLQTPNRGEVSISGHFTVDAAGAVSDLVGEGFTAVKEAAAGTWTITLDEPVVRFISVHAFMTFAAAGDSLVIGGTPVVTAGIGAFGVFHWDVSGGAVANRAGQVHFEAIVSKVL